MFWSTKNLLGRKNLIRFGSLLLVLVCLNATLLANEISLKASDSDSVTSIAQPFLKEHCLRCHGPDESKSDLRLDQLDADLSQPSTFDRWREIVSRVQSGEMPPIKEPRPQPEQVADVVKRLSMRLDDASATQRTEGRVVLRRLNRVEYENTVRDLFDVNVSVKEMLPEDGVLTHASVLKVTANGTTTSPVIRGVWFLDRILGRPVPPPPPNVPAVEPDIRLSLASSFKRSEWNMTTSNRFSRRTLLRRAGVTMTLPLLEAMGPSQTQASALSEPPRRMICINTTLGLHTPNLFPATDGRDIKPRTLFYSKRRADSCRRASFARLQEYVRRRYSYGDRSTGATAQTGAEYHGHNFGRG